MGEVPAWVGELDLPDVGLVARVVRLNLLVGRVLDDITSAHGIAPADYVVLGVLRRSPGYRSAPTRMCELLDRSTGGMTLTIDRLEASGWVTRSPDPDDRRRVVVTLTERGLELSERVNAALHAWEEQLGLDHEHRTDAIRTVDHLLGLFEAGSRERA
ncbi:MAG TPA: MarR family transcriptional regulator [Acidimicrobiia bacterium]|nr:MarR family transcriptional regulator [Acidimicrobiia bacterium]